MLRRAEIAEFRRGAKAEGLQKEAGVARASSLSGIAGATEFQGIAGAAELLRRAEASEFQRVVRAEGSNDSRVAEYRGHRRDNRDA